MAVPAMIIDGDVVAVHSYWTDDGSRIVTEATVAAADGQQVVVSQLGGIVDGIGQRMMPGPEILEPGMQVAVAAHRDLDLSQREHVVLDSVRVLAYPPDYVRTSGPNHEKLYWAHGCAYVTVDAAGTKAMALDQELAVIDAAIAEWNTKTDSCSSFKLINAGTKASEVGGKDSINLIKIRDTSCTCPPDPRTTWCRPATGNDPQHCMSPDAAGITTATYVSDPKSPRDGEIVDADIELNNVNFAVTVNGQPNTPACHADLQNTLTHELGHLHGLEHTCWIGSTNPGWTDNQGNPVPACIGALPASITDATMYPTQNCGETKKGSLEADDIQSMCDVYPKIMPKTCAPVGSTSGGGCCSASDGRPEAGFLMAGTTVLLVMRRRKTRRETSRRA